MHNCGRLSRNGEEAVLNVNHQLPTTTRGVSAGRVLSKKQNRPGNRFSVVGKTLVEKTKRFVQHSQPLQKP
jgi:hypothetical protein